MSLSELLWQSVLIWVGGRLYSVPLWLLLGVFLAVIACAALLTVLIVVIARGRRQEDPN